MKLLTICVFFVGGIFSMNAQQANTTLYKSKLSPIKKYKKSTIINKEKKPTKKYSSLTRTVKIVSNTKKKYDLPNW